MPNKDINNIQQLFRGIISGLSSLNDTEVTSGVEMNRDLSKTNRGAYIKYMADEYAQGKPIPPSPEGIEPEITNEEIINEILERRLKRILKL